MTGMLSPEELRTLVREVLRDVLPGQAPTPLGAIPVPEPTSAASTVVPSEPSKATASAPSHGTQTVVLASDADLDAFVRRLLCLFENPRHRQDLLQGRLRFRLSGSGVSVASTSASNQPVVRVERGAVTERQVRDAGRAGARIVVTRSAVVTPLARDRARALGVNIDKEL